MQLAVKGGANRRSQSGRPGSAWPLPVVLAVLFAASAPELSAGQAAACKLHSVGGYTESRRNTRGDYTHYASGGVDYRCADGVRILADSAYGFESRNQLHLFRNVRFEDPEIVLEAGQADYWGDLRVLAAAEGAKVSYTRTGTVVWGEKLDYYRESESRLADEMIVTGGQPHATVYASPPPAPPTPTEPETEPPGETGISADTGTAADTLAAPAPPPELPPFEIDARRFMIRGRTVFWALDSVTVYRGSLRATGDSLYYDQITGAMSLVGKPRVDDGRFTLVAESVSITPGADGTEEILARGDASLEGAAVAIRAPAIRLFLNGGDLGRLVALASAGPPLDTAAVAAGMTSGDRTRLAALARQDAPDADTAAAPARPTAYAQDLTLIADSLEVLSPGQVLKVVYAVGSARAETVADESGDEQSAPAPEIASRDWMEGDTVVATFLPPLPLETNESAGPPPGQTPPRARLETLVAAGDARSFYRVPPDTTRATAPEGPPSLHWAQGRRITMVLDDGGTVVRMQVEGQTVGYHLEPAPPAASPDSAAADTARASAQTPPPLPRGAARLPEGRSL